MEDYEENHELFISINHESIREEFEKNDVFEEIEYILEGHGKEHMLDDFVEELIEEIIEELIKVSKDSTIKEEGETYMDGTEIVVWGYTLYPSLLVNLKKEA